MGAGRAARHSCRRAALVSCGPVNARILAFVAAFSAGAAAPALAAVAVVPTLPVSALHAGQHAVVRTVFAGDSIETFDADIMGVMAGGRADGEYILARATSPRVVACGIAAGMSGSPVYVDGKLIGALSMGWPFSREPIFGITPIGEMLAVLDQPESAHPDGTAGPVGVDPGVSTERYRGLSWSDDSVAASPAPSAAGSLRALPLPLAAGGLSPEAMEAARGIFANSGFQVFQNTLKAGGLGLNLTRQIIEIIHRGRMIVASEVGRGSTFGFALPIAA